MSQLATFSHFDPEVHILCAPLCNPHSPSTLPAQHNLVPTPPGKEDLRFSFALDLPGVNFRLDFMSPSDVRWSDRCAHSGNTAL
jgi:hypothetical protein